MGKGLKSAADELELEFDAKVDMADLPEGPDITGGFCRATGSGCLDGICCCLIDIGGALGGGDSRFGLRGLATAAALIENDGAGGGSSLSTNRSSLTVSVFCSWCEFSSLRLRSNFSKLACKLALSGDLK